MSLSVPLGVLVHAETALLKEQFENRSRYSRTEGEGRMLLDTRHLTKETYADLVQAAEKSADKSFTRVVNAIVAARGGEFDKSVPSLVAFPEILTAYLRAHFIDGWLYTQDEDEVVKAFLVTSVKYHEPSGSEEKPKVQMTLVSTGRFGEKGEKSGTRAGAGLHSTTVVWYASEVAKKRVADILQAEGYLVETEDLRAAYDLQTEHHRKVVSQGYTEQFRFTGKPLSANQGENTFSYEGRSSIAWRENRKVINVSDPATFTFTDQTLSKVFGADPGEDPDAVPYDESKPRNKRGIDDGEGVVLDVPISHVVRVFDLGAQDFMMVHTGGLDRYKYDQGLADKLVLPKSHRHLLDILTTDLATFTGDIIEGKSAGNVVLAKGSPGVGKTLTAEVYSEIMQRPLYSIHSGSLGVSAESVRKNLEVVFDRAKRWNAVLLLDEADVFVNERGLDISQNAIVAEFLRTMEYFDGLMFMTTNRAANVDDAVLSRCAAIIAYEVPGKVDQIKIWHVLAKQFDQDLDETLADDLSVGFSRIAPRDIKMMLRLALRVASHEDVPLSVDVFQRVALFRGLTWDDEAYDQYLSDTGRAEDEEKV